MEVVAILIFAAVLVAISFEWIHRTKAALAGAGLVVIIGAIDGEHAIESVGVRHARPARRNDLP